MKRIYILLFIILLVSCSANKNMAESNINQMYDFTINSKDVSIITPYIEIKEKSNRFFLNRPDDRKMLTDFTIEILKSKYPNFKYVEIPFLFKDYGTINSALERRISYSPEAVPNELVINNNGKSIFISINGYFGDVNRGVMSLYVIDNKNKMWKMIERYRYNYSPLETKMMKKRILRALKKL